MSIAFITGATRGIGRHIATYLAERGWDLGLIATDRDRLKRVADTLRKTGVQVVYAVADVGNYGSVASSVDLLVIRLGIPDLLINNAGQIDAEVPIWESDPEQIAQVLATNLLGPLNMENAVVPMMVDRGEGRIINMVSGAGARDWAIFPAYTVSKTGLIRNVGDLHAAGFDLGLRAFGIAPGVVRTDMTAGMKVHAGRTDFTPVGDTLALIGGIIDGELDEWSGAYLRAGVDTVEALKEAAPKRIADQTVRSLGIITWGPDDPLA